ncbi:hypothetical protein ACIQVL_50020 [Streptomyces sp. NPDC090499]|uniref:hypothetical protein n=1 Tax=Streptomyces sp. NPDC090499 TaxID=3365965 RepID=UPI003809687C
MPLLMPDPGNTPADRNAAFRDAVTAFLTGHRLPGPGLTRVTALDTGGRTARHDAAAAMTDRHRDTVPTTAVHAPPGHGAADRVVAAGLSRKALDKAHAARR